MDGACEFDGRHCSADWNVVDVAGVTEMVDLEDLDVNVDEDGELEVVD